MKRLILAAVLFASTASAHEFVPSEDDKLAMQGRAILAREHPDVMRHLSRNDGFGGASAPLIARQMLSTAPEVVAEARAKMTVESYGTPGKGLWLIRFPYVNVAVVETGDQLVLIDSGYASVGEVLKDVLPTLSPKPLKTIVLSHVHVDHAYGARALMGLTPRPDVIASDVFPAMMDKEIRLGGSIGRFNNQPLALQPTSRDDVVMPNITFRDRMERTIGGEKFVFIRSPGETEEQIWVWLPDRKTIFTADYYQGFLPNAGNGKRITRHITEWAQAFRQMAALQPELMLPMHNAAVRGKGAIGDALTLNAQALEWIDNYVVDRLNAGERKDVIAANVPWPEKFAKAPLLDPEYNRPADIARMVARRWTGWWDDIPSHFAALPYEAEAREAVRLAGGVEALDTRARELLPTQPMLAARLADWAQYGAPDDPRALRLAIDVYLARLAEPDMPVQESTIYLDVAARARARLAAIEGAP
ncbi:MBL fold metallo-hydrolase [Tsuneonella aeria]|nr:MBL fold metallo-hydrolase [Tsuneonella aeria]